MRIVQDDLTDTRVQALVRFHRQAMRDGSPPEHSFALDLDGLRASDMTLWSAWIGDSVAGIGALRQLDPGHGEIKSMRTAPEQLRTGVGAALLRHMLAVARARGYRRVSLETGSGSLFEPALAFYRRFGFVPCDAFGDYAPSAFNQFFTLEL